MLVLQSSHAEWCLCRFNFSNYPIKSIPLLYTQTWELPVCQSCMISCDIPFGDAGPTFMHSPKRERCKYAGCTVTMENTSTYSRLQGDPRTSTKCWWEQDSLYDKQTHVWINASKTYGRHQQIVQCVIRHNIGCLWSFIKDAKRFFLINFILSVFLSEEI